jgi:predicted DNA-binding ribbon-helix-helix protein
LLPWNALKPSETPISATDPCGSAHHDQVILLCFWSCWRKLEKVRRRVDGAAMNNAAIIKRSVRIAGHATSVSLEAAFWQGLHDIAAARGITVNALLASVDAARAGNLSSAIRLFVLDSARNGELP